MNIKGIVGAGKTLAEILGAAGIVVDAASALQKKAKPVIDGIDTEGIANRANAAMDAIGHGRNAVGIAFGRLNETRKTILAELESGKGERELAKAIKEAKQLVLENATTTTTVAELKKQLARIEDNARKAEAAGAKQLAAAMPLNTMPGCFVIATYKALDFDKDLTDYLGVYVGKSLNVFQGVMDAMSRKGNPDVYADVKYRQNVHIYVFNCLPEELDENYQALMTTMQSELSYNAL